MIHDLREEAYPELEDPASSPDETSFDFHVRSVKIQLSDKVESGSDGRLCATPRPLEMRGRLDPLDILVEAISRKKRSGRKPQTLLLDDARPNFSP